MSTTSQVQTGKTLEVENSLLIQNHDFKSQKAFKPEKMTLLQLERAAKKQREQEEQVVNVVEAIEASPLDAAYALWKVLGAFCGGAFQENKPGSSWGGGGDPKLIGVNVDHNQTIQVPFGVITSPTIAGSIETKCDVNKDGNLILIVSATVMKKDAPKIHEIAVLTRAYIYGPGDDKELADKLEALFGHRFESGNSIYRNAALKIRFPNYDSASNISAADLNGFNPEFMDLSGVKPDELIFSEELWEEVDTNLFTPIKHPDRCKVHSISLKRGVLLAGPYGTGKTLTAKVAAFFAKMRGWTFLYVEGPKDLPQAINFSKMYGRTVIFCEDIDSAFNESGRKRTQEVNDILNTIDGIDTKDRELIFVLTTNHVENINEALLRPGRMDAFIEVLPPDAAAAEALMRQYGRGLIPDSEDLTKVGEMMAGIIPAFIREVVEKAKLSAIRHVEDDNDIQILASDLEVSARNIRRHIELVKPKTPDNRSDLVKAAEALGDKLTAGFTQAVKSFFFFWKKEEVSDTTDVGADTYRA